MNPTSTRFRAVLATTNALALTLSTASCTSQEMAEPESSLNQAQAEERTEVYIDQAATELPGDVELSEGRGPDFPACEGEPGDEDHKVNVHHVFWVDGIPETQNGEVAEYLYAYWNTGNWHVTTDERPENPRLKARNRADDFGMDLVISQDGRPSIATYSPCVHADENS